VANGWYDPHKDTSFNFRKVYGHKDRSDAIWNIARKWVILDQLAEKRYDFNADFPFSVRPKKKVGLQMLIDALSDHYENTAYGHDPSFNQGSPHHRSGFGVHDSLSVCNLYSDFSCITQLRNWLPGGIGNIVWIAPRYPCIQPFIPWYYGITNIQAEYEAATYSEALANYNNRNLNYIGMYPAHSSWVFDDFANKVDSCYGREIRSLREWKGKFQADIFAAVHEQEGKVIGLYGSDSGKALQVLTGMTNGFAKRALKETKERLASMDVGGR
jgi:dipeptidase